MARFSLTLLSVITALLVVGGAAQAQTISIVSGQGQVTCPLCPVGPSGTFDNLVVQVKDASGNPAANYPVTFTPAFSTGDYNNPSVNNTTGATPVTVYTGADGTASVTFQQGGLSTVGFTSGYSQSTVTATAGASSVVFYETTSSYNLTTSTAGISSPTVFQPSIGTVFTGQAGQIATNTTTGLTSVQIYVRSLYSLGVPNVEVRLLPTDSSQAATAACQTQAGAAPGGVFTDGTGLATCNVQLGSKIGTGQFTVQIGNRFVTPGFGPYNFEVTAGLPCAVRILNNSGNQSGTPGTQLPAPLIAQLEDCGGNPLPSVPMTWTVTQGTGTFTGQRTSTDSSGRISTYLTPGGAGGPLQVTLATAAGTATSTGAPVSVAFNFNITLNVSGITKLAGDNQSAAFNQAFGQPLTVQVNGNSGAPLPNITVNFIVASGSVSLSSSTAVTNSSGQASVIATAGANAGAATVTASVGSASATFSLTVQPPGPQNVTFSNAASGQSDFISPCSLAVAKGTGLATGLQGLVVPQLGFGPWLTTVSNVSLTFGSTPAPIYSVANQGGVESVTFEVPCELQAGAVPVNVRVGSGQRSFTANVRSVAPGVFETAISNNRRIAVLVKPDGTFVSEANPARKGERIRVWVTGVGQADPAVPSNSPGIPGQDSIINANNLVVGVNNAGVPVISADYVSGLIGVSEIAFQVPSDVPAGLLPFAVAVNQGGTLVFGNGSLIPVQ